MRSFAHYISKHLVSFAAFILILLFLNAVVFGLTFQKIVTEDYGDSSPQSMLEMTAAAATPEQLSVEAVQKLRQNDIWAIYLNADGQCYWSIDLPENVPESYTIQDVALFSKGYIEDYPVFVWNTDDGLLVLGYPKDSYTKLTNNYYSIAALRRLPAFVLGMLGLDVLCLFLAYYFSKRRIIHNTEPIVSAVETLADGKPVSLHISGELSEIARRVCYSINEFFQCIFFFVFPITNKSVWINKIHLINNLSKGKSAHKAIIKTYHRLKSCPNFGKKTPM